MEILLFVDLYNMVQQSVRYRSV